MYPATFKLDFNRAVAWAKNVMMNKNKYVVLDTETTGLRNHDQPVEITITNLDKKPLLNVKINPTVPIHQKALAVHGIPKESLEQCPMYPHYHEEIVNITRRRNVLIFNAAYDTRIIQQVCHAFELPYSLGDAIVECAMLPYAAYCGDWNSRRQNYTWQKLPGGDHTALGDCHAVIDNVLVPMAESELFDL